MPDLEGKSTAAARISLARIMTVVESNLLGTVHGGVIMKMVDDTAGAVAQRHAGGPAVTAAMDGMTFLEPVQVGDLVQAHAQVNWAGRTSMEVGVRVMAEPWNQAGQVAKRVATAYLVFVAVDADGQPRNIPPVLPETDEDRRRFRRPRSAARADWPAARPSWPAARSSPGHPPRRCYRPPGVIDPGVIDPRCQRPAAAPGPCRPRLANDHDVLPDK